MTFFASTLLWAGVCLLLWIVMGLVICRFFAINDDDELDHLEDDAPKFWKEGDE